MNNAAFVRGFVEELSKAGATAVPRHLPKERKVAADTLKSLRGQLRDVAPGLKDRAASSYRRSLKEHHKPGGTKQSAGDVIVKHLRKGLDHDYR